MACSSILQVPTLRLHEALPSLIVVAGSGLLIIHENSLLQHQKPFEPDHARCAPTVREHPSTLLGE